MVYVCGEKLKTIEIEMIRIIKNARKMLLLNITSRRIRLTATFANMISI